jgi:hypothetical protein
LKIRRSDHGRKRNGVASIRPRALFTIPEFMLFENRKVAGDRDGFAPGRYLRP